MSDENDPKQDNEDEDYKPSRWRVFLAWGLGVVGVTYLIVAGVMFWNADPCISIYVDQSTRARFWAGLTCMTANEMGDMLAGMFAPLAFLGLIIAILLQGQDLELQRADQVLTRKVMEAQAKEAAASAKALKAQAEEAKRTAEFMGEQADYLKSERLWAELTEAQNSLKTLLTVHPRTLGQGSKVWREREPRLVAEVFVRRASRWETEHNPFASWLTDDKDRLCKVLVDMERLTKKLEGKAELVPSSNALDYGFARLIGQGWLEEPVAVDTGDDPNPQSAQ